MANLQRQAKSLFYEVTFIWGCFKHFLGQTWIFQSTWWCFVHNHLLASRPSWSWSNFVMFFEKESQKKMRPSKRKFHLPLKSSQLFELLWLYLSSNLLYLYILRHNKIHSGPGPNQSLLLMSKLFSISPTFFGSFDINDLLFTNKTSTNDCQYSLYGMESFCKGIDSTGRALTCGNSKRKKNYLRDF